MPAFDILIKCSKKLHDNNFASYSYHLTLLTTFLLTKLVDLKVDNLHNEKQSDSRKYSYWAWLGLRYGG